MAGHHHRAAGEERIGLADRAPEDAAVPLRRPLVGMEGGAHGRVDAVGGDQQVRLDRLALSAPVDEARRHPLPVLLELRQPPVGADARPPEPFASRLVEDHLQPAAVDGILRPAIAGVAAARLAPDLLAVPVGVDQFLGLDRRRGEPVGEAQFRQFAHRMRQQVDADAERSDLRHRLEQRDLDAGSVQGERRRQPADPAARHDDLHAVLHPAPAARRRPVIVAGPPLA
mgnify:CR=1 FL=1